MYEQSISSSPWTKKASLDRCYALCKTAFGQYQASSATLGWPGDGDFYFMHKIQSGGWCYAQWWLYIISRLILGRCGSLIEPLHLSISVNWPVPGLHWAGVAPASRGRTSVQPGSSCLHTSSSHAGPLWSDCRTSCPDSESRGLNMCKWEGGDCQRSGFSLCTQSVS